MNDSSSSKVAQLRIDPSAKRRSHGTFWTIFVLVGIVTAGAFLLWRPWETESRRVVGGETPPARHPSTSKTSEPRGSNSIATASSGSPSSIATSTNANTGSASDGEGIVLTVSGYIINRERIELSPRFMGQVRWIGVKKGDAVTNGQVVVLLDDAEYQAQKRETLGRRDMAQVQVRRAELELTRVRELAQARIETQRALDFAELDLAAAQADVASLEGQLSRIETWIDWTVIRSPINGVVLEKLVDPNELVTPQSFGGTRGPSTALISVGDPKDLQVEIDLNEADLSKVGLGQKCRVSPEAYLQRNYDGTVAEVAPEASRQKGTLQIKVQIHNPDRFLTPELSAKVDFFKEAISRPGAGPP